MKSFFNKFTVYLVCFSIVFMPYRQANAAWWGAAAVVIDVVTEAWPDGDHIKTGAFVVSVALVLMTQFGSVRLERQNPVGWARLELHQSGGSFCCGWSYYHCYR